MTGQRICPKGDTSKDWAIITDISKGYYRAMVEVSRAPD